jgi:hypothetical protein
VPTAGAGVGHRLVDLVGHVQRRHRHVGRGQHLGHRHQVGLQVEHVGAEALAQAAEAGDDLVGDEQDVVLLQHRLHAGEVARRRDDHAAGALHRLGDEGADGLGAFGRDQRFQLGHQPVDEGGFALAGLGVAVEVRCRHAQHAGQRQVEVLVHRGQARQRRRRRRHAVVALLARDDLLLQRLISGVVVVAHQLERGVVALRARVGEQQPPVAQRRRGRPVDQLGHQFGHRPRHLARERVVVRQRAHLR